MRRTMVAVALLSAFSAAASRASAQMGNPGNPFSFGVSAGASIPTGDFADGTKTGFNAGAHLGIRQPLWPLGLRLDGQYNRFEDEDDTYFYFLSASLNAVIMPGGMTSRLRPYLIGGPGYFRVTVDATENLVPGPKTTDNRWGFTAGAGIEYSLSRLAAFLEARYNWVKVEDNHVAFVPISVGIMFH